MIKMDYGITFSQMLSAMEEDLRALDDFSAAMEANETNNNDIVPQNERKTVTITRSAEQGRKTDNKDVNDQDQTMAKDEMQEFVEKANTLADGLTKTLERVNKITLKLLENAWAANDEFISQYDEMKSTYKQVEDQVLINWSYGHNADQYLHSKVTKLRAVITTNANYMANWENMPDTAILNKKGKELDKEVLAEMGAPSSIDTLDEFFGHLRAQFRGRKSEKTYHGQQADQLIQDVRNFAKTRSLYNQDIAAIKRLNDSIKNTCIGLIKRGNYIDEDRRKIINYQKNLIRMLTIFCNMVQFTYRMDVEYITNRRILITRLYEK